MNNTSRKVLSKILSAKFIAGVFIFAMLLAACHPSKQGQNQGGNANNNSVAKDNPTKHPVIDSHAVDGLNTIKYPNGVTKARGYYQSGKKIGEWQSFYEDGQLWSDENFTDGYPDGPVTVYYDEYGKKMYEGQYKMGKPVGMWKYLNKDGTLKRTADYDKKAPNTAM